MPQPSLALTPCTETASCRIYVAPAADRLEKSVGYVCTTRGGRLRACNLLEGLFPVGKQHAL